jgi:putative membrane protein
MGVHILLMNACAPLLALAVMAMPGRPMVSRFARSLAAATVAQIVVLWAIHAPGVLTAALEKPALHVLVQAILFAVALWFWLAVLAQIGRGGWRALAALLITGKLFCLLGILLTLAPRVLYPHHHGSPVEVALADQQLAGLMMVVACPLTYVLAGVIIAARWIVGIGAAPLRVSWK